MRRKRAPQGAENHERWLVSYADFMTLLFAFFVVMFASSQADKGKAQQVSDSVKRALDGQSISATIAAVLGGTPVDKGQGSAQMHGPGGYQTPKTVDRVVELLPSLKVLSRELKDEIQKGTIQVSMGVRGLTVSFRQAALFPSGGDEIAPEAYPSIRKVANAIRQIPNPVRLEGHTDSVPIHNSRFRSNWELSAARSIALLTLLTDEYGVSHERISIAGYADTTPVASNETDDGRTRNRRVDVVILNETGSQGEPERPLK
jgi:chemotaxis protein MotB